MVARFTACDKRRLREVLIAGAAGCVETEVAEHLETCASCRRDLEQLAGGVDWWSDARSFLGAVEPPAAEEARGDAARHVSKAAHLHDSPLFDGWRKQLGFLAASEEAGSLGRLGPYEITDCIGRGGMGIVLKAFDPALNRHVAIKVLAAEWAHNATARRRFAREAQAAAAVVHDHVVPIHAVDANGEVPFLVMAYIPGHSLQERLDRTGPLELKEILRIGMQTAGGLAAAHAQGLVHRDIKPANILLEDGVERVRITDFGLARAVDDVSQTQSGILAGTPQYMSPEQAAGETIDHRADLFSLGSVLYAMCTGRSPFRAESTVAVLRRICDGRARAVREINPDVPDWLAEIIDRLHEKRPADRMQTADEIAELLERRLAHLQEPSIVSEPARLPAHGPRVAWRLRAATRSVLAAGLVIAVLAGGFLAYQTLVSPFDRENASRSDENGESSGSSAGSTGVATAGAVAALPSATTDFDVSSGSSSSSSATVAGTSSRTGESIEGLPIDAEFERLGREVYELETNLYPRLPPVPTTGRAAALVAIEQRLKDLENALNQGPRQDQ